MKIDKYTIYQFDPTPEYVIDAMKDSRFKRPIRKRKDMYMIVGIQVADSAIVYHLHENTKGGGAKGGAPIGATGVEVGGEVDMNKESQMLDISHIDSKFVFAYRIKACVREDDVYGLRSGYKAPSHSSAKLYDTDEKTSTAVAEDPHFKLSRIDANEDMIEGKFEIDELKDGEKSTERMIILEESHPWWLYYTSAIGVLVYAWLAYYLVRKFT